MNQKMIAVSKETHSQLFSLKNQLVARENKKFIYDDVMMFLLSHWKNNNDGSQNVLDGMYQLEEKQ